MLVTLWEQMEVIAAADCASLECYLAHAIICDEVPKDSQPYCWVSNRGLIGRRHSPLWTALCKTTKLSDVPIVTTLASGLQTSFPIACNIYRGVPDDS